MIIAAIILANLSLGLVLIGATEIGLARDIERVENGEPTALVWEKVPFEVDRS